MSAMIMMAAAGFSLHAAVRPRCMAAAMKITTVESTPNPSAFLLRLDTPLEGISSNQLRGETFRRGRCPPSLAAALDTEGVASIYAVGQVLTVSKTPSASWENVLPPVVEALGGAGDVLAASGSLLPSPAGATTEARITGGVTIRLQVSMGLPIQVEAVGWSGSCPPVRAKLSARFGGTMTSLMDRSSAAFFEGRAWLDRGLRYPELDDEDDAADELKEECERRAITAALENELAEVEEAYPDARLTALVDGPADATPRLQDDDALLDLEMVDVWCGEDAACEARGDKAGMNEALNRLAAFVDTRRGVTGARRNAIAYLGGTAGRGGDIVFDAIAAAFRSEKAAGLRRTAGDALSDLGDARAVPLATAALADRSTLVRWRAARILGELGEGVAVVAALKQAHMAEKAFECAFEMKDAHRKVGARDEGGMGGARGPMWKQIQEGMQEGSQGDTGGGEAGRAGGVIDAADAAKAVDAAKAADAADAVDGVDGAEDDASAPQDPITAACEVLAAYDQGHRAAAASEGAKGFGGGITANEWAAQSDYLPLADAVRVLWEAASRTDGYNGSPQSVDDGRLILGICADDAIAGVATLKAWVTALGLPKGPLHGMDVDGEPLDMRSFGAVYIKYNSLPAPNSVQTDPLGTARLTGYNGDFRGVYVNANLADGVFRQYAVLPIDLFAMVAPVEFRANTDGSIRVEEPAAARAVSDTTAGSNTREGRSVGQERKAATGALNAANIRACMLELPEYTELASLGIGVMVREVSADQGRVLLAYEGPANLRRAAEFNLANALREAESRVRKVDFVLGSDADER